MSRGAVVAVTTLLSVMLYRLRVRRPLIVVMVILLALSTVMPNAFYERMGAVISGEDDTGSGRTVLWATGLKTLGEFGLLGGGLENQVRVYERFYSPRPTDPGGMSAHNLYLSTWMELGIIGLGLLLMVIAAHLLAVRKARQNGYDGYVLVAMEAACVSTVVGAIFSDVMWTKPFWLGWILLIWATSCAERSHNQMKRAELGATSR
jgi:O-antigen ligase